MRFVPPTPNRYLLTFPDAGVQPHGVCYWRVLNGDGEDRPRGYRLQDDRMLHALQVQLRPELADLLDLALAAYTIDRLSPRAPHGHPDRSIWQRELTVELPVRDLQRWKEPLNSSSLTHLLNRLTDDDWSFDFRSRRGMGRPAELQLPLFKRPSGEVEVGLYSGGLDSAAGTAGWILKNPSGRLLCVSGTTNSWISHLQSTQLDTINSVYPGTVSGLRVDFGLESSSGTPWREESSQRTRGFIHFVLGVVTAMLAGSQRLLLHENGVGALNLPMSQSQHGSHMTQACHPVFLAEAAQWVSAFLGEPFRIVGTALGKTKAQSCCSLREAKLEPLVGLTFSCDGFQRVAGVSHCGTCTSCLLRRQSIYASSLEHFDRLDGYVHDVTAVHPWIGRVPDLTNRQMSLGETPRRQLEPREEAVSTRSVPLQLMLDQICGLRDCVGPEALNPWPALLSRYPALLDLEAHPDAWTRLGGPGRQSETIPAMYRTYVNEWRLFPLAPETLAACGFPLGMGDDHAA